MQTSIYFLQNIAHMTTEKQVNHNMASIKVSCLAGSPELCQATPVNPPGHFDESDALNVPQRSFSDRWPVWYHS